MLWYVGMQCVRQYSEAYVLLHGLCQQAQDARDRTQLNQCQSSSVSHVILIPVLATITETATRNCSVVAETGNRNWNTQKIIK